MITVFIIFDDIIWNCSIFFHDVLESTLENLFFCVCYRMLSGSYGYVTLMFSDLTCVICHENA
uniref:Ovule protein n=1 Tax=Haemonchus contortus TaxID=6289 RepID=A0A7I4YRX6_HAECO